MAELEVEHVNEIEIDPAEAPIGAQLERQFAQAPAVSLFGDDPEAALDKIDRIAAALTNRIRSRGWMTEIVFNKGTSKERKSEHVQIEGWTMAGALSGVTAGIDVTQKIKLRSGVTGYRAHAVVRTLAGVKIGEGWGMCLRNEDRWKDAEEFHVEGMAQTRARAGALEGVLRFLIEEAGFDGTAAERMDGVSTGARQRGTGDTRSSSTKAGTASEAQRGKIAVTVDKITALIGEENPTYKVALMDALAAKYELPQVITEQGPDFKAFAAQLKKKDASEIIDRLVAKQTELEGGGAG